MHEPDARTVQQFAGSINATLSAAHLAIIKWRDDRLQRADAPAQEAVDAIRRAALSLVAFAHTLEESEAPTRCPDGPRLPAA